MRETNHKMYMFGLNINGVDEDAILLCLLNDMLPHELARIVDKHPFAILGGPDEMDKHLYQRMSHRVFPRLETVETVSLYSISL